MLIGWSSTDITPYGRRVNLRGQFHARFTSEIADPVTATALALQGVDGRGGEDVAIMISVDLCMFGQHTGERVRYGLGRRLDDFDPQKLLINATHTHTAPAADHGWYPPFPDDVMSSEEYEDFLVEKLVDCAVAAWEGRRSGAVARAFGHAVVGHNRRAVYADGRARMYGAVDTPDFDSFEGYEDHSVNMLFTYDQAPRQLTGVIVNLACPSQVTENAMHISADYWHETRQAIRARLGDHLHILPQCSAAGDQSPHFLLHQKEEAAMRERLALTEREVIAGKIADAVAAAAPAAADAADDDPIVRHKVLAVDLPRYRATKAELDECRRVIAECERMTPENEHDASIQFSRAAWYGAALARHELARTQPTAPVTLHALRLGETAFATNPFELFLDYGLRIQARSVAPQTFLVQLAGGALGYLPTAKARAGGHYSAIAPSCHVGPEGGQVLVDRTVDALAALWPDD